ncbi:MAG: TIGR04282 family arsenosugar biosynthesis glycosyltransferase [Parafilimonas sp.]
MNKNALLIFTKNAVLGKVKTRLAATVGKQKALEVYKQLIQHTHNAATNIDVHKIIFYADEIVHNDVWNSDYEKQSQQGFELGERMLNAFDYAFSNGFFNVAIIGTDCPELTEEILNEAFTNLKSFDVVIGAAEDGGYYLLGMKKLHAYLFENIKWSTGEVCEKTIAHCKKDQLSYYMLPMLHDVDEEKDLKYLHA